MAYETKVYVVQKADRDGNLGEVLAVKLSHGSAHQIAKDHAPAKVHFVIADKSETLNVDHGPIQTSRN
jgi:hypothetical protein